jgi:hypothetical protein
MRQSSRLACHFLSVDQQLEGLVPVVPNEFDGMTFIHTDVAIAREAHDFLQFAFSVMFGSIMSLVEFVHFRLSTAFLNEVDRVTTA